MSDRQVKGSFLRDALFLLLLLAAGLLLGQHGIPVEDGGEMITVARLGGTMHPPGMPLLALLLRISWFLGENGPLVLMALCGSFSLWLLFRESGPAGLFMSLAIISMPEFRERILAWDAYGPLFLLFSIAVSSRRMESMALGYLTGLAVAVHPAGILLPAMVRLENFRPIKLLGGFILGAGMFLMLPVMSAAGCAVDWGAPGTLPQFLRQISAAGFREVYGSSMGRFDAEVLLRHLGSLWRMLWPAFILPVSLGAVVMLKYSPRRLLRPVLLLLLDMLFVLFINPMASGTSQTAWLSLLVFCILAVVALTRFPLPVTLVVSAAIAFSSLMWSGEPLPDQEADVGSFMASAPIESGMFLSDNDLLYGCWMQEYGRDMRPDMVLLSTGNFSPWFERLARRFNPDLDTSGGLEDAGGPGTPREVVVARLIEITIQNNPHRRFFTDR